MWNMDVLPYLALRTAIKAGDISRIEDLLPTLLFRFAGGSYPKYTIEMLELFQGLRREWPEKLRDYIKEFCWLFTRTGGVDSWLPFDLGQEENICQLPLDGTRRNNGVHGQGFSGDTGSAEGPVTYGKAVPNEYMRGSPWSPDKEKDVVKLAIHYASSQLHTFEVGRKLKTEHTPDVVTEGASNLKHLKTIETWFRRWTHARAVGEDWSEEDQDSILLEPLLATFQNSSEPEPEPDL
ncbi:hypothetical protein DFH07DRAFT_782000 [Mycena maculata]|uniref:DUF6589 domain-containing protein n=1 Tax=Mycena maculata TaxID=230809 RepID=A0AAD7HVH5_9AGAR|nr:hypothetical protein DFH07DRAFT_782000 [Mycena maculata]